MTGALIFLFSSHCLYLIVLPKIVLKNLLPCFIGRELYDKHPELFADY